MTDLTRRAAMATLGAGLTLAADTGEAPAAAAQQPETSLPRRAPRRPKPLRFNPARLNGLSERLITSHWQNNYGGSVNALNMVEERLALAMRDPDFPPLIYGDLKREELHRTGSVVLHELYFDNLGGDGRPGGGIRTALGRAFGSYEAWEAEFRRTAMSLSGGSGWCILALNTHTGELHNYWMWDHMHAPASGVPLLALDMYEHSYHMDYGSAAARYIDAFMRNVDWEEVDRRHRRAIRIASS